LRVPDERPPRAVIDTCVFGRLSQWIAPLVLAARQGDVELVWSPTIIAEVHRLLTWMWLRRHGGDLSERAWQACSADAKGFLRWVRESFRVVEDRPPDEILWTEQPRDEWDIPLWNTAVRSQARFVVTENLKDGPPVDARGVRQYQGVIWIHPGEFLTLLQEGLERGATDASAEVEEAPPIGGPFSQRALVEAEIVEETTLELPPHVMRQIEEALTAALPSAQTSHADAGTRFRLVAAGDEIALHGEVQLRVIRAEPVRIELKVTEPTVMHEPPNPQGSSEE
jgi:predicted nucleic acid-binding protein